MPATERKHGLALASGPEATRQKNAEKDPGPEDFRKCAFCVGPVHGTQHD